MFTFVGSPKVGEVPMGNGWVSGSFLECWRLGCLIYLCTHAAKSNGQQKIAGDFSFFSRMPRDSLHLRIRKSLWGAPCTVFWRRGSGRWGIGRSWRPWTSSRRRRAAWSEISGFARPSSASLNAWPVTWRPFGLMETTSIVQ